VSLHLLRVFFVSDPSEGSKRNYEELRVFSGTEAWKSRLWGLTFVPESRFELGQDGFLSKQKSKTA